MDSFGTSRTRMTQQFQREIRELVLGKKVKAVLIIDGASLIRLDVFAELHILTQFDGDSKPYLPIVLAGQSSVIDKLSYCTSQPLASRIVARSHLEGVNRQDMEHYLCHHLSVAGIKNNLFDQAAVTAIHQGSGGLFRKANHLVRVRSSPLPKKNPSPSPQTMSVSPQRKSSDNNPSNKPGLILQTDQPRSNYYDNPSFSPN